VKQVIHRLLVYSFGLNIIIRRPLLYGVDTSNEFGSIESYYLIVYELNVNTFTGILKIADKT